MTSIATTLPALAAIIPTKPGWGQATAFILMGFAVVMAVLAIMWLIMVLLGMFFAGKKPAAPAQPAASAAAPAPAATAPAAPALQAQQASAEDHNRLVAVISAAVHYVLGRQARVIAVLPTPTGWSTEGRREIFASHRVR